MTLPPYRMFAAWRRVIDREGVGYGGIFENGCIAWPAHGKRR